MQGQARQRYGVLGPVLVRLVLVEDRPSGNAVAGAVADSRAAPGRYRDSIHVGAGRGLVRAPEGEGEVGTAAQFDPDGLPCSALRHRHANGREIDTAAGDYIKSALR